MFFAFYGRRPGIALVAVVFVHVRLEVERPGFLAAPVAVGCAAQCAGHAGGGPPVFAVVGVEATLAHLPLRQTLEVHVRAEQDQTTGVVEVEFLILFRDLPFQIRYPVQKYRTRSK